jgi:pimeloyl-ACP methyl ester carboxylesterase
LALACALVVAFATGAVRADSSQAALQYCTPDGGPLGMLSDREHTVVVGDQPPPPGVRRTRETVDGITTPVMQAGPADATEAVVFIHGNPGSSRDYDRLVAAVGGFARVAAFDMPGFGHADKPFDGTYTTQSAVRFIDDMLTHLGITRVDLALHDFGGLWALDWASTHTERLASVVLMDTGVLTGYRGHVLAGVWDTPVAGELDMAAATRQTFKATLQAQNPRPLPQTFLDRMYDDFDRATRCAVLQYYRDWGTNNEARWQAQTALFRKLSIPALVIWGADDPYIPSSQAENQKNAFPAAEVHVLADTGHWPFVDEPDVTRSLVVSFLRRVVSR